MKTDAELDFGLKLQSFRKSCHLTQKQLADALDCSDKSISRFENGDMSISLSTLIKMSEKLQIPLSELVSDLGYYDEDSYAQNEWMKVFFRISTEQRKAFHSLFKTII